MKQHKNVETTKKKEKVEVHPVQNAVNAKVTESKQPAPPRKLFPHSRLFQQWGEGLSEAQQKDAQDLFQRFGYNVYLSNQLPHNRSIPDTRDARWDGRGGVQGLSVIWGELWKPWHSRRR
jgi:polypeptide N-acetylgalactosaminyltransferase